ncbi:MAG: M20/M25/M40 family metallo-hydrolase [Candidatus Peribacteraceae bacterium]|nr:M20/M25/M40 family metallo-hydrolase [Candidatus Peribacteraceae bacterium]
MKILSSFGLKNVHRDAEGNAIGFLITHPKQKKFILLCAHADTACDTPSPIRVREDATFLHAHGICDNAAGVTALLTFLKFVRDVKIPLEQNYLVVFTVGEEGLGAKRGMKRIITKYEKIISHVVNIESHDIGRVTNACVGQYRADFSVIAKQKGAHSWRNFGEPNAVVILSSIIHDLSKITRPKDTTYNVTAIQGGKSINAIPGEAKMLLEFRAERQKNINALVQLFHRVLRTHKKGGVTFKLTMLSMTKAASMPKNHLLCTTARKVQRSLGIRPFFKIGNTDGDVSLARGIPTVTLGASNGFATHSLEEKMEKKTYLKGVEQVIEIILALDRKIRT